MDFPSLVTACAHVPAQNVLACAGWGCFVGKTFNGSIDADAISVLCLLMNNIAGVGDDIRPSWIIVQFDIVIYVVRVDIYNFSDAIENSVSVTVNMAH